MPLPFGRFRGPNGHDTSATLPRRRLYGRLFSAQLGTNAGIRAGVLIDRVDDPMLSQVALEDRQIWCAASTRAGDLGLQPEADVEPSAEQITAVRSSPDPLQGSRLKIQFAFCLGVRYASHLSPVVNRIRTTTRFQSILNRYLRRWWSIQPLSKRREPS